MGGYGVGRIDESMGNPSMDIRQYLIMTADSIAQLWITFVLVAQTGAYLPDEMECPDRIHPGIESPQYHVPYGQPYRAWRTLPWHYFVIKPSSLSGAGLGVFTTTFLAKNTWLGEFDGEILSTALTDEVTDLTYAWDAYRDDTVYYHIDGLKPELSNWLRFVNMPNHISQQNIEAHVCYGRIFYRTTKDLAPGQELLVFYGDQYAEYLEIDLGCYYNRSLVVTSQNKDTICK